LYFVRYPPAAGRLCSRQGAQVHGTQPPIFEWAFVDGGTRIAYGQEPVHFGCETHYELRDIESERLIEAVDIPQPCGLVPDPKPVRIPPWVAEVTSNKTVP